MFLTVLYLLKGWRRFLALVSQPILFAILSLCCVWFALWPKKRPLLARLRAKAPCGARWRKWLFVLAGVVTVRWPLFVGLVLGAGALIGLILAGPGGVLWGLGSAVFGASLAPVLTDEVPPHFFQRSKRR